MKEGEEWKEGKRKPNTEGQRVCKEGNVWGERDREKDTYRGTECEEERERETNRQS